MSPGTCLLTGGDGGIGRAVAASLRRDGWRVFATGLGDPPETPANDYHYSPANLGEAGVAGRLVEECVARFGGITGLVHCAGRSHVGAFPAQEDEDWDALIDVNLTSLHRVARAVSRQMLASGAGGAFVAISSIAWTSGGANPAYGAAKGGVNTLVYNMAQALGPSGIRVNAVAPGIIATDMVRGAFPGDGFAALERAASARTPLRRLGRAEDVAETVAFLMSERAAFITGAVIPITGGIELLPPIGNLLGARE